LNHITVEPIIAKALEWWMLPICCVQNERMDVNYRQLSNMELENILLNKEMVIMHPGPINRG
jgi:aspartate carbamoyltransferase catalytic subunit